MARPQEDAKPFRSDGFWHLLRRVPKAYADVDRRKIVTISTGIAVVDDPKGVAARRVVRELDETLFTFWRQRKAGGSGDASVTYEQAVRITREAGLSYVPNRQLLTDVRGLVSRLEALESSQILVKGLKPHTMAMVGAVEQTGIRLSQMIDLYKELNPAEGAGRSKVQQHRWDVTRKTAVDAFIGMLGADKQMSALTYDDVMTVNNHLQKRIAAGEIVHDTANKCISRVAALFRDINRKKQLKLTDCFAATRIEGGRSKKRPAFPIRHVQEKILSPGMLDGLNDEARDIVYFVAETGLRPSEAVYLLPERIRLDAEVPYIQIRPDNRMLKTEFSERDVPLVGLGLEVMRRNPKGFAHYRARGAGALEALVSKAFRTRQLILEEGQCFYSLRHTFEDRLQAARAPEKVITFLMGHKWHRELYGSVPLEEKAFWMKRIGFRSPYR
ncbi:MAG: integrase [Proteobacteria bacterium]|nr:integrase [Pseudomonadota bacterium]